MIATSSMALTVPHVRSGRLRALGITTATRSPALPDIPTIPEAGVPGYEAVQCRASWRRLRRPESHRPAAPGGHGNPATSEIRNRWRPTARKRRGSPEHSPSF